MSYSEFGLPDEVLSLRSTVNRFMEREVLPRERGMDPDAPVLEPEPLAELQALARASNRWCLGSPAEQGGAGLDVLTRCVVIEEASKCRLGAYFPAAGAFGTDPPNVIFGGTPDQIERYGKTAIAEGHKTFVALTEPSGGSDPARAIQTQATRDGQSWVLNGTKTFISYADTATWGVVFARTGPGKGRDGVSCFIVETATPGFSARPIPVIRSWAPCEVVLQDCRIPSENLLRQPGQGFQLANKWLTYARPPYAAGTIGVAQAALDLAVDHAQRREVFGEVLGHKQAVQWMLADSEVELRAARALVYDAARRADAGFDFRTEASVAKLYATEAAGRVVDRCVQILGGMGVSRELPLERWYRELRIKRIGEGPSEVHRMVVARDLLGRIAGTP